MIPVAAVSVRRWLVQVTVLSHHPRADGGGVADGGFVVSETQC